MNLLYLEGRLREVCSHCGWIYYEQLKATAGLMVEREGEILLVKRSQEPWKGAWYLPAGYLESDESPEQGALRELKEETGMDAKILSLAGVYYYDDDPRGNGLLIVYKGFPISTSFKLSDECEDCSYFTKTAALSLPLAGIAHQLAINDWVSRANG